MAQREGNSAAFDDFASIQQVIVWARWILIALFLFLLDFRPYPGPVALLELNLVLVAAALVNARLHWNLRRGRPLKRGGAVAVSLFELAAITAVVALTEAFRSSWFILYFLSLLGFSIAFSRRAWLAYTGLAALAYTLVSFLFPPGVNLMEHQEKLLVGRVAVMFALAYMGDAIIGQERRQRWRAVQVEREAVQEVEKSRQQLAALHQVSTAVSATLGIEEVVHRALEQAMRVTGTQAGEIWVLEEGDVLVLAHQSGLHPEAFREKMRLKVGQGIVGQAVQSERPLVIPKVADSYSFLRRGAVEAGFVSMVSLRLRCLRGLTVGVMSLFSREERGLTEEELSFIETVAATVGTAIDNARLHNSVIRSAQHLAAVNEAAKAVTSMLDPEVVLQDIVDSARSLVDARYAALGTVGAGGGLDRFVVSGVTPEEIRAIGAWPQGVGLLGELLKSREAIRLTDLRHHPHHTAFPPHHPEMTSFLGIPVLAGDRIIGRFYITNKQGAAEFSAEDERVLTLFAAHAAIAVENARHHANIEEKAQELSREMVAEKSRFEYVLQGVADGVYFVDPDIKVLMWNAAAERILGFAAPEVMDRPCADFLKHLDEAGNELCDGPRCPLRMALESGQPTPPMQLYGHAADGRLVPLSVTAAPVRDAEGNLIGAVEVFRDVTREREIEGMKSDFVSTVSHELRTPLSSILGFSELLLTRQTTPERQQEWTRIINDESRRLSTLVDDLLDLSRIEAGRIVIRPEPLELRQVVEERLAIFQPGLTRHRLTHEVAQGLPPVLADRDRLTRILDNLLSNAIKYSPEGGEITVAARQEGEWVQVSISDQGLGIPPDKLETIFQPFEQVESFIQRQTKGVGLGLAITRASVELHGGRIWAESQVGKGSTFHFTLPLARQQQGGENG